MQNAIVTPERSEEPQRVEYMYRTTPPCHAHKPTEEQNLFIHLSIHLINFIENVMF